MNGEKSVVSQAIVWQHRLNPAVPRSVEDYFIVRAKKPTLSLTHTRTQKIIMILIFFY